MRLIDADKLILTLNDYACIEAPKENEDSSERRISEMVYRVIKNCIGYVKYQPTAYDVDKVTHEINNKIQELDAKQQLFIENGLLNMADKMASKIGIYIECREIVEKAGN